MDILYDGNFALALEEGPIREIPNTIPGVAAVYVIEQDMTIDQGRFAALPLNTVHPTRPGFYLVEETELQDIGGGVEKWTRRYAKVPQPHNEPEDFPMNCIGLFAGAAPLFPDGLPIAARQPFTRLVTSRVQCDYFLTGTGGSYVAAQAIPQNLGIFYVYARTYLGSTFGLSGWPVTQALGLDTIPTCPDYTKMMQNAAANRWGSAVLIQTLNPVNGVVTSPSPVTTQGQFAAENSRLDRWKGNIFRRMTRYVLAI